MIEAMEAIDANDERAEMSGTTETTGTTGMAQATPTAEIPREEGSVQYVLTPSQRAMFVHYLLLDDAAKPEVYFNQQVALLGAVEPAALRRAWQRLHDRHEALRSSFGFDAHDEPVQLIAPSVALLWQEHDWRTYSTEEQERRFEEFLTEDQKLGLDLTRGPLSRVALVRFGDSEWRQVWSFSHLIVDGWSMALVLGELGALYDAEVSGREAALAPTTPLGEFAAYMAERDPAATEAYWRNSLAGIEPAPPFPFDGTGGSAADPQSLWIVEEASRTILAADLAPIRALARQAECTLNTVIQALWAQLLARYQGTNDVCFGVISSGRPFEVEGIETTVGLFIVALPVRLRFDLSESLRAHLAGLQSAQFDLREHEQVSHDQLMTWAGVERELPLYESVVIYENYPVDPLQSLERALEIRGVRMREANNLPFSLYVAANSRGLKLKLSYHWSRIDARAAEQLLDGLVQLLESAAANPFARLGDLTLTSVAEREQILALSTGEPAPEPRVPIHLAVFAQAAQTPESIAVEAEGETLTYAALAVRAHQLAHHLRALGVGLGFAGEDRVGVCLNRTLDLPVALLAVLETGAAYVPLDPTLPAERLAHMLAGEESAPVRWVVAASDTVPSLPSLGTTTVVDLDRARTKLSQELSEPLAVSVDLQQTAYVIYTSGSTGKPKGVLVPHVSLAHYAEEARRAFEITASDRVLQFASINFDTCVEEIYPTWLAGGTLVLRSEEMIESIEGFVAESTRLGITVLDLPTAYWHEWVAEISAGGDGASGAVEIPASLRLVILGGEAAHRDRWLVWRAAVGERVRLINTYGPTEATVVSTRFDLTRAEETSFGEPPIGRPISSARAFVVDVAGQLAPIGCEGELWLGGRGLVRGYLGSPDLSAFRFVPDPFSSAASTDAQDVRGARLYRTGDRVRRLRSSAADLEFLGRTDAQVKIRGQRIELGEIEQTLRALPAVREAVVVAPEISRGEHEAQGERTQGRRLVAFLVANDPASPPSVDELRQALLVRLTDAMIPSAFVVLDALPRTAAGKIDVRALSNRAAAETFERAALANEHVAPRTALEEQLAEVWREVLRVERVGVFDNFFSLGGDSILAIQAASRSKRLGLIFSPRQLYLGGTVAALAESMEGQESRVRESARPSDRTETAPPPHGLPLSPAQHAMLIHYVMLDDAAKKEIYFDQQVAIYGALDVAVLRRSWQRVHDRHDALRAAILADAFDEPVQKIAATVELPWREYDWRDLAAEQRERRFQEFLKEDQQESFELSRAPLSRVALFQFGDDEWRQVWSFSHFMVDGWSTVLVLGELAEIYRAELSARPPKLAPVTPLHEFTSYLTRRDPAADEAYWRAALLDIEPAPPFPFDGSGGVSARPDNPWIVDKAARLLTVEHSTALQALARQAECTLNTVVQALWGQLLARYQATNDVCFGIISSGRPYEVAGIESMVGMFIAALPVRLRFEFSETVQAHLTRLQREQFDLREHEQVSFEKLMAWSGVERDQPLYESVVVYENYPATDTIESLKDSLDIRGLGLREAANLPFTLFVAQSRHGLSVRLIYHWSRIDARAAEQLLDGLVQLLESAAANPFARLGDLTLTSVAEREQILALSTGEPAPEPRVPIHLAVFAQAAQTPESIAVEAAGETLTYAALAVRAHQLAHHLRALGVGLGFAGEDRVGVCLNRTLDLPVALLAVLETGAAYVPLDPTLPAERLAHMLAGEESAPVRWVVAASDTVPSLPSLGTTTVVDLDRARTKLSQELSEPLAVSVDLQQTAYVIYTSGSTGRPKGVLVPHVSLAHYAEEARRAFEITASDRVLQFASINFDTCVEEIYPTWLAGGTLVLRSEEMIESIEGFVAESTRLGITVLDLPTAYWHEWVAEISAGGDGASGAVEIPASLRLVILGGEAAHRDRWLAWRGAVGERVRLINTYGPTEATVVSTRFDLTSAEASEFGEPPIGRPISGARAFVVDVAGQLAPIGCEGELWLGGRGLVRGYLGSPELSAFRFVPDPFSSAASTDAQDVRGARLYRTGDRVRRLRSSAADLEFLGRTDAQVKIRGQRIELGEIEQTLRALPAVREAVVVAPEISRGEHESQGERTQGRRLVAFLVANDPASPPSVDELRQALLVNLTDAMIPSAFVVLDALPRTAAGKIDVRALSNRAAAETFERAALANEHVAPRTALEEQLAEVWREVLRVERVGVFDNFFSLGGDSILALQAASRSKRRGVVFTPRQLFEAGTIAGLATVAAIAATSEQVPLGDDSRAPVVVETAAFSHSGLDERELAALLAELS